MNNYPAYCIVEVSGGNLVDTDDRSHAQAQEKFSGDDLNTFNNWAGTAHTGDYIRIGNVLVTRRNG